MPRPIIISLSPNVEPDDVRLALAVLLSPWKWFDPAEVELLEREFAALFGPGYQAIAVNSGRSAQYLILRALDLQRADQVLIQAFTCVAVPNSILWAGAQPRYTDIDESYNLNPAALERQITPATRAIVVQHTFGIPANLDAIRQLAEARRLTLIEDCSHSLGAAYREKPVGTWGEVAFFSFGRDKILSSVFGGMILCREARLAERLRQLRSELRAPPAAWVAQQLLHPVALHGILPLYNLAAGKVLLVLLQKLHLLSKAVYEAEKLTQRPAVFPAQLPGGLAILARNQLKKLSRYNEHRRKIAQLYFDSLSRLDLQLPPAVPGAVWLRLPVRHPQANALYQFAKRRGILLGDWYRRPVVPVEDISITGYAEGSCPVAEDFSATVINLPTYPALAEDQARKVVATLSEWLRLL